MDPPSREVPVLPGSRDRGFAAFSVYAVIPMGPNVTIGNISTPLQLTDMPVASLYILAIASLGLYSIVLGGWSTRSTLPLYGAVRSSAQVISYELAMGLSLVSVFLMSGTMSTSQIVAAQGQFWWHSPSSRRSSLLHQRHR